MYIVGGNRLKLGDTYASLSLYHKKRSISFITVNKYYYSSVIYAYNNINSEYMYLYITTLMATDIALSLTRHVNNECREFIVRPNLPIRVFTLKTK